jgi:hypothetical protein
MIASFLAAGTLVGEASAQAWRPRDARPLPPTPGQIEEAKQRYEKGVKLYEDEGSVQAALVEFERAYDLAPNYKVLYNIGQAARTLRDYATALRAFEAYLEGGKDKLAKPRLAEITRELAQLRTYVATLTIDVDVPDAVVALDGVVVGATPLTEPQLVNAGRTTITATKAGRVGTLAVTLAGGDNQTVRLELPRPLPSVSSEDTPRSAPGAPAALPPLAPAATTSRLGPPPPPAAAAPTRTFAYVAFGVGGALAISASATGFSALRASKDLERRRFAGPRPSAEANSLRDKTRSLSKASDVLTGTAVAAVGLGVVLLVLERPAPRSQSAATTVRPWATLESAGAGVEGSF